MCPQVDLIVDPDATFFKASWSKHTNFCQQDIEISQNSGQMAYGQEIQYQVGGITHKSKTDVEIPMLKRLCVLCSSLAPVT